MDDDNSVSEAFTKHDGTAGICTERQYLDGLPVDTDPKTTQMLTDEYNEENGTNIPVDTTDDE
jgi:hypothetical protein